MQYTIHKKISYAGEVKGQAPVVFRGYLVYQNCNLSIFVGLFFSESVWFICNCFRLFYALYSISFTGSIFTMNFVHCLRFVVFCFGMMTSSNGNLFRVTGPCITNVIATCRKNFSQWESSFLWKLRCHWLKFLRRVAKTLVIQGPGPLWWESNGHPSRRPVTRSFDVFLDRRLNKRLSEQPRRQWFETP